MEINLALIILFSPLIPFLIYLVNQGKITSLLVIISGLLEVITSFYLITFFWGQSIIKNWSWLQISNNSFLEYGIWLNNYSLGLLFVVAVVSLMVRLYALNYLVNENRRSWFMVLIGFFTFAMYGLVLSSNLLGIFFFWEWVGLASYLMIGFLYQKQEAAEAARKAFLYNKFGDLGFILALGVFYFQFESFDIQMAIESTSLNASQISVWFSLGIVIAAFAKSAQMPFSNWLVDAMEGPTPASALIHSATMVTAGIYLLIRCFPLLNPVVLDIGLYLGIITVLWSGITAIRQNDIKKILAYSTISQLGFMLLGVASGNIQAAFFHLITHAFFKSSLFLSAGVVINQQSNYLRENNLKEDPKDIRMMNGFWQQSPYLVLLIIFGALALSALPLFSAYLSKEAIIAGLQYNRFVFSLALLASFVTALYSGRIIFHLLKNSSSEPNSVSLMKDLQENFKYYIPISVLVILSLSFVYALNPFDFSNSWLYQSLIVRNDFIKGSLFLLIISSALSISGLLLTYLLILRGRKDLSFGKFLDKVFHEGFYLDKYFNTAFTGIRLVGTNLAITIEQTIFERIINFLTYSFVFIAMIFRLFDTYIVDGFVRLIVGISIIIGETTRQFQGGKLRNYLFWLVLFLILGLILIF